MALNVQQQRIANFLAQGLKTAQICSIVGVTPAYISQLCSDDGPPEFKELVQAKALEVQKEGDEEALVGAKYLSTEHKLLNALESMTAMMEPKDVIMALKVIGERQEKRAARKAGLVPGNGQLIQNNQYNVTQLVLPAHAVPELQLNSQGQVIAVGDKPLSPMSSAQVREMFKARKEGQKLALGQDSLNAAAEEVFGQEVRIFGAAEGEGQQAALEGEVISYERANTA